jgi:hypothetical protein
MIEIKHIKEATRSLATNSYLRIVETTRSLSRNRGYSKLQDVIKEDPFEIYEEEERGEFTFIEARELKIDLMDDNITGYSSQTTTISLSN